MRPSDKLVAHVAKSFGGRLHGSQIIFQVYNMAMQMMDDRGQTLTDSCASESELLRHIDETHPVLRTDATLIYIDAEERTGVKLLRTLLEKNPDVGLCILTVDGPTPFTKREVSESGVNVEFWQFSDLLINPTKHALVPRHTALSEEATICMQRERCILPHQWPAIQQSDIIVRWLRIPKGTVIRIERLGIAHERADFYRKVE